jgi:hypothetical protein
MAAVLEGGARVYSANSLKANIVKVLNKGDLVRVRGIIIGSEKTWCLVSEEGRNETLGYVSCSDLKYRVDDSKINQSLAETPDRRPAPPQIPGTAPASPVDRGASQAGLGSLLQAVWNEDASAIKELLQSGVNPNARTKMGTIPLHVAARKAKAEITRMLIAHGADINAADENGLTPLMSAASAGHVPNIETLLAAGADINAKDGQGFTALIWAVIKGSSRGVEALIENKAEINAKTKEGRTALWYSKQLTANARKSLAAAFRKNSDELIKEFQIKLENYEEILKILESSGAKE